MSGATYIAKDQNHQDETTIYWFDVEGEVYGVAESEGTQTVVGCDGAGIAAETLAKPKNDHIRHLGDSVTEEMRNDY